MLPQNGGVLLSGEQPSSNTLGLWTKEVMVAQNSSVTAHMDKCNDLANRRRICHSSWFLLCGFVFLYASILTYQIFGCLLLCGFIVSQ